MNNCPVIVTYIVQSTNGDYPSSMTWAAAMVPRIVPKKGKTPAHTEAGTSWLATGRTEEEARGKLEAIWLKQFPPISEKELARRASAGRKPTSEPVAAVDEDIVL